MQLSETECRVTRLSTLDEVQTRLCVYTRPKCGTHVNSVVLSARACYSAAMCVPSEALSPTGNLLLQDRYFPGQLFSRPVTA